MGAMMTPAQAAQALQINVHSVTRAIARGELADHQERSPDAALPAHGPRGYLIDIDEAFAYFSRRGTLRKRPGPLNDATVTALTSLAESDAIRTDLSNALADLQAATAQIRALEARVTALEAARVGTTIPVPPRPALTDAPAVSGLWSGVANRAKPSGPSGRGDVATAFAGQAQRDVGGEVEDLLGVADAPGGQKHVAQHSTFSVPSFPAAQAEATAPDQSFTDSGVSARPRVRSRPLKRVPAWVSGRRTSPLYSAYWRVDSHQARLGRMHFQLFGRLCGVSSRTVDSHRRRVDSGEMPEGLGLDFVRVQTQNKHGTGIHLKYVTAPQRAAWLEYWSRLGHVQQAPTTEQIDEALAELARWTIEAEDVTPLDIVDNGADAADAADPSGLATGETVSFAVRVAPSSLETEEDEGAEAGEEDDRSDLLLIERGVHFEMSE